MDHLSYIKSLSGGRYFAALALGLAATGAAVAADGTRYYVNDHLATTVGIADAAGEIAALEADAFGLPLAAGASAGRFTGKPYDEDLGAYVFPFRNYRADEARWMSADPSGFPDGVNPRVYRPNPMSQLDPLGLVTIRSSTNLVTSSATNSIGSYEYSSDPAGIYSDEFSVTQSAGGCYTASFTGNFNWTITTVTTLPVNGQVFTNAAGSALVDQTAFNGIFEHEMGHVSLLLDFVENVYRAHEIWVSGYVSNRFNDPDAARAAAMLDMNNSFSHIFNLNMQLSFRQGPSYQHTSSTYGRYLVNGVDTWRVTNANWADTVTRGYNVNFTRTPGNCE